MLGALSLSEVQRTFWDALCALYLEVTSGGTVKDLELWVQPPYVVKWDSNS